MKTRMGLNILKVAEQQFSPFTFQLGPPAVVQTLYFREFIVKLALKQICRANKTHCYAVQVDNLYCYMQ